MPPGPRWARKSSPSSKPRMSSSQAIEERVLRIVAGRDLVSSDARSNTPRRFGIGRLIKTLGSVAMRCYSHLSDDEREQIGLLKSVSTRKWRTESRILLAKRVGLLTLRRLLLRWLRGVPHDDLDTFESLFSRRALLQ
jgi:hypothetical protein